MKRPTAEIPNMSQSHQKDTSSTIYYTEIMGIEWKGKTISKNIGHILHMNYIESETPRHQKSYTQTNFTEEKSKEILHNSDNELPGNKQSSAG